ncbi:MAG: hypothetical protein ACT4P1_14050 [Sporichthyaceae bacterium]
MSAGFEVDNTSWDDFLAGIRAEADALRAQRLDAPGQDPVVTAARWLENLAQATGKVPGSPVDAQAAAERYRRATGDVLALLARLDRSTEA